MSTVAAVTSQLHHNGGEWRLERDRAAVEAAAQRIPYDDIATAWTASLLGDPTALHVVQARVPVAALAAHEAAGAIILSFATHTGTKRVCLDLIAYREGNTVRTRHC